MGNGNKYNIALLLEQNDKKSPYMIVWHTRDIRSKKKAKEVYFLVKKILEEILGPSDNLEVRG